MQCQKDHCRSKILPFYLLPAEEVVAAEEEQPDGMSTLWAFCIRENSIFVAYSRFNTLAMGLTSLPWLFCVVSVFVCVLVGVNDSLFADGWIRSVRRKKLNLNRMNRAERLRGITQKAVLPQSLGHNQYWYEFHGSRRT